MHILAFISMHPPMAAERAGWIIIIILDPEYKFLQPETYAKWAQDQNWAQASPPGTACLIGKKMIKVTP